MIIHTVVGNRVRPKYGASSIPIPILTDKHPHIIELLRAIKVGNIRNPDCHAAEIDSPPPVLKCLEDTDVNVDELDYLAS